VEFYKEVSMAGFKRGAEIVCPAKWGRLLDKVGGPKMEQALKWNRL